MDKVKVAIIDDGIYPINVLKNCDIESYEVVDLKITKRQAAGSLLSHGTICAYIIEKTCKIPKLIDLKILNENKRGLIGDLVIALEWCLQNNIKLIHMSLGTLNFHDYILLKNLIKKLIENGSILVSAIHNSGLKSFPAFCDGVFAVRRNTNNKINSGEFGISHIINTPVEKCFVAEFNKIVEINNDKKIQIENANSFATAVLTGYILSYLKKEPDSNRQEILRYLILNGKYYEESCKNYLNYSSKFINQIYIPIIEVNINNIQLIKDLYYMFRGNGYNVEVFSDLISEQYIIPLDFYCDGKEINKDIIKTCCAIYKPDIIIICLSNKQRPLSQNIWKYIDMSISEINLKYHVTTKKQTKKIAKLSELYNEIFNFFV